MGFIIIKTHAGAEQVAIATAGKGINVIFVTKGEAGGKQRMLSLSHKA